VEKMKRPAIIYLVWKGNICQAGCHIFGYAREAAMAIGGKVYSYLLETGQFIHEAPQGISSPWRLPKEIPIYPMKVENLPEPSHNSSSEGSAFEAKIAEGAAVTLGSGGSAFEAKIAEYMVAGKKKAEAIRLVVIDFPDLHAAYVSALESRGADSEAIMNRSMRHSTPFEMKVAQLMAQGKKKGEAVRLAARDFPELHAAYVSALGGITPEAYLDQSN
jgi:uncharacterized protein YoaH (UPF0181 family)